MPKKEDAYWIEIIDGICSELNVDPSAAQKSKDSFLAINRNYTLDVSIDFKDLVGESTWWRDDTD